MKSKRNKAQDNQTPAALPLANTKASSLTNEPKHKIEAEESSSKDDDIEMSNEDAILRLDQDVALPKSKSLPL